MWRLQDCRGLIFSDLAWCPRVSDGNMLVTLRPSGVGGSASLPAPARVRATPSVLASDIETRLILSIFMKSLSNYEQEMWRV